MPTTTGLILNGRRPLSEMLTPLSADLARCYWVVDVQSGPFTGDWLCDVEDDVADAVFWPIPAFEHTSTCGLRPGVLPRMADQLVLDEWSYCWAIDRPEPQAVVRANKLAHFSRHLTVPGLNDLNDVADLFLCHVHDWWEVYTARVEWSERLREAWPDARDRSVEKFGTTPI